MTQHHIGVLVWVLADLSLTQPLANGLKKAAEDSTCVPSTHIGGLEEAPGFCGHLGMNEQVEDLSVSV